MRRPHRRDEASRHGSRGPVWRLLPAAAALLLAWGCHSPGARVWNLRQVHQPDGRPKYTGDLHGTYEHLLYKLFETTPVGRPQFISEKESAIKDPLSVCLKNLNGLAHCDAENRKTRGLMVEMFTWLGGDCTYALSRERCAVELGDLARRAGVDEPLILPETEVAAGPDEVGAEATGLYEDASPMVAGQDAPVMRRALAERCEAIQALTLDRDGARRLLSVTNLLLSRWRVERIEGLKPLLVLHLDLEKRCIALALGKLLSDPEPRVRAAAVRSCLDVADGNSPELLQQALEDPSELVRLEVLRSLERHGVPHPGDVASSADEASWIQRVVEILRLGMGGPLAVAGCEAMARLTGTPRDLHPEHWIVWWEDVGRARLLPDEAVREESG